MSTEQTDREKELAELLTEARHWIWSFEVHSSQLANYRDKFLDRVERALVVQGKTYKVQK